MQATRTGHPARDLGALDIAEIGRSGKFDHSAEMLAEIVEDGDRALVFAQCRTTGDLLADRPRARDRRHPFPPRRTLGRASG